MPSQSKVAYTLPEPVPSGAPLPVTTSSLMQTITGFIRSWLPPELATVIVSMITPPSSKSDSLHLQLGPDGVPYALRRYLTGSGWVPMQLCVPQGVALPAIPGVNPADRAYANGMLYILTTCNTLYVYDALNNLWRTANSQWNIVNVSGSHVTTVAEDVLSCTGGNFTITLANPTTCPGKTQYVITDQNCSSAAPVTLSGSIRGSSSSLIISSPNVALYLISNGSTWLIMNTNVSLVYNTTAAHWTVSASGGSVVSTNTNYSVQLADDIIRTTAGSITIALPDPTTCKGKTVSIITDTTAGSSTPVSISGNIRGASTTIAVITTWTRTTLSSDGITWS